MMQHCDLHGCEINRRGCPWCLIESLEQQLAAAHRAAEESAKDAHRRGWEQAKRKCVKISMGMFDCNGEEVANAIAAMILISIITKVSTSLFGDKLGFIIAAIASMVAMNVGTALSTGTSLSSLAGEMMNAQNIMQLTSSVGNGISQYINASTAATIQKAESVMQQYNTDMMAINKQYEEMFGTAGQGVIDPMQFVSMESMDSFLSRTLMTGSDIADMSLNMIGSYSDMTLNTDLV